MDFMTRKRINVAFLDKGFVDPMVASCCQKLLRVINNFDLTIEKLFNIFDKDKKGSISKDVFMKCI